jgi:hypothetical protein
MANTVPDSQLEFNLGEGEEETTVQLPEQEEDSVFEKEPRQEAPAPVEAKKQEALSQELDNVSENVQKRIAKLTAKMREAERREQAAIEYAKGVQAKSQELQRQLEVTDTSRLSEAKSRMETQAATLKSIIKRAREEGDIDTETEAQERLFQLTMESQQVSQHLSSRARQEEQMAAPQAQPRQAAPQQAAPQRPRPSPRAEEWAENNAWFGKDKTMTYAAWGIHATMVEEEGFDPESEEYYTELDNRLRSEFPQKFGSYYSKSAEPVSRQRQNVPAVAPASRSSGVNSARKTVKLSPSQVAIAKRLGVPLEEYAKHVKE